MPHANSQSTTQKNRPSAATNANTMPVVFMVRSRVSQTILRSSTRESITNCQACLPGADHTAVAKLSEQMSGTVLGGNVEK